VWAFDYFSLGFFFFHEMTLLTALLSFATFLKAAQFFFYPWLLDAMEAPVPISAQLHSSTLVIIGFYLSFRFITFFQWAPGLACL
jgi:NADH:ubiquinone oxidoreductase subunit 5 (subunit L)/multisubunit Na+/H+ antiporter MnhA subunit